MPKAECGFELMISGTDAIKYYQLGRWETGSRQDASEYWVLRVCSHGHLNYCEQAINECEQARDRRERDEWISALKSAQKQHAIRNRRELIDPRTDEDLHAVLRLAIITNNAVYVYIRLSVLVRACITLPAYLLAPFPLPCTIAPSPSLALSHSPSIPLHLIPLSLSR